MEHVLPRRLGPYTLFTHIGKGGMANIFLAQADAYDQTAKPGDRLFVIKEILPGLAKKSEFVETLISEAGLAARLDHPNIVKVAHLGYGEGSVYIAMEYVEGLDLR